MAFDLSDIEKSSFTRGYRPEFYRLPGDGDALERRVEQTRGITVHDHLLAQLGEWVKAMNPSIRFTKELLEEAVSKQLNGRDLKAYGVWVFYPWSNRLVHLLDEKEFTVVRTDRNRNKITREEQERLAQTKVGVIGLSVGQSVSLTMALERSFGEIRLADFDTLDLSNLNRLRAGVHQLGENKALITAREIAEVDPFLNVTCFTDGLTKDNMNAFFTGGGKLDLVVEECDSVDIKILARQKAKALGIPVVMDMSDRGCLDVERFDLEPERPLMHGWIDHLDLEAAARPMTAEEKVPYMIPITGVETLSPRMKASVIELGQTVSTWPQLATSVVLGGALAGDAARRILLDQFHRSGRWFVDLDELVGDPPAPAAPPKSASDKFELAGNDLALIDRALGAEPAGAIALDQEQITNLVEAGGLAPSADNMQPWKFLWHSNRLILFEDGTRSKSFWDPDHFIAHIALGACVENVVLKAHELGLEVKSDLFPVQERKDVVAAFEFHEKALDGMEPRTVDHLAPMIGARCTNRKHGQQKPVPAEVITKLDAAVGTLDGCEVKFLDAREDLATLAGLCGAAERIRVINPIGHKEFFQNEVRWTEAEARRTGDGLDIATLELRPMDLAGMQVAADPHAMALIDHWKAGKGLENISGPAIRSSPAAALISCAKDTYSDRVIGGRALERFWMTANADGLSVHPISAPIFLTHVLQFEMQGLRGFEREELALIQKQFDALWKIGGRTPLFMVRLSPGGQPSVRSLRRPVKELMIREPASVA